MAKQTDYTYWIKRVLIVAVVLGGFRFISAGLLNWWGPPASVSADSHLLAGNYDQAIRESTANIDRYPDSTLVAGDFNRRGLAYLAKRDIAHAILDYDEAIRRRPNFSEAYYNRCTAWLQKADLDRAFADCGQAANLEAGYQPPREVVAQLLLARGDIAAARKSIEALIVLRAASGQSTMDYRFYRGQIELFYDDHPAAAADDFAAAFASALDYRETGDILGPQRIDGVTVSDLMAYQHAFIPDAYYAVLWLRIARARAHQNYASEFAENVQKLGKSTQLKRLSETGAISDSIKAATLRSWPGQLLGLYLGEVTPEEILNDVTKTNDEVTRQRFACEADFYLAGSAQEQGRLDEAQKLMRAALSDCSREAREYGFANAELMRMQDSPTK